MKRQEGGSSLGKGMTVAEWVNKNPDRFVTRRDITFLFAMFDNASRRKTWFRRLWRWLTTPLKVGPSPEEQVKAAILKDEVSRPSR